MSCDGGESKRCIVSWAFDLPIFFFYFSPCTSSTPFRRLAISKPLYICDGRCLFGLVPLARVWFLVAEFIEPLLSTTLEKWSIFSKRWQLPLIFPLLYCDIKHNKIESFSRCKKTLRRQPEKNESLVSKDRFERESVIRNAERSSTTTTHNKDKKNGTPSDQANWLVLPHAARKNRELVTWRPGDREGPPPVPHWWSVLAGRNTARTVRHHCDRRHQ